MNALSLKSNLLAMTAGDLLNINSKRHAKLSEKLSSGYRVNRAADDAVALAISEKMRRQIRGLNQGTENILDGIGYLQVGDGALVEVHDMLQRMNELAVKSANGTNTDDDRAYIDQEFQQLKSEMDRIFETTTFNERNIWEITTPVIIGYEQKQALQILNTGRNITVTNENAGILACNGYTIHADTSGVNVTWIGYDGHSYQTDTIDWDTLAANNYSFNMSDYFGADDGTNPLYANHNPVFNCAIKFDPLQEATVDDMIACVNNRTMSVYTSASMSGNFENASGTTVSNGVRISSISTNYPAQYASNSNGTANVRDFNHADDVFLTPLDKNGVKQGEPGYTGNLISAPAVDISLDNAKTSRDAWIFQFDMDGIGTVTAKSNAVRYYAPSDTAADDENYWWNWSGRYVNGIYEPHYTKSYIIRSSSEYGSGTLGDVMAALTGEKGTATPGLLTQANGGDADHGGTIYIDFSLTAANPFTYGNGATSQAVGSMTLSISVSNTDTEQSILDKINHSLRKDTPDSNIDFYSNASNAYEHIYSASAASHQINVPIYGGKCELYIQAGPEPDDGIDIIYDHMSLRELGLFGTDVRTASHASAAIDDIKKALTKVSEERTVFGAYQNRLEHSINNNNNVAENTQAAESLIRDTDMAKTMIEYANYNILLQANQSMLAQANQMNEMVLKLLQ